jgi:hypothetical protein
MKVSLEHDPKVIILPEAKEKMDMIVDICSQEVSWLGTVKREPGLRFIIEDVYLVEQESNSVTTEIDPSGHISLYERLLAEGKISIATQDTYGLYLWGHSHHTMGVSPSGQDQSEAKKLMKCRPPFLVRIIANKRRDYNVALYLVDEGVMIEEMTLMTTLVENTTLRTALEEEIKLKVKPFRIPVVTSVGPNDRWTNHNIRKGDPHQNSFDFENYGLHRYDREFDFFGQGEHGTSAGSVQRPIVSSTTEIGKDEAKVIMKELGEVTRRRRNKYRR